MNGTPGGQSAATHNRFRLLSQAMAKGCSPSGRVAIVARLVETRDAAGLMMLDRLD